MLEIMPYLLCLNQTLSRSGLKHLWIIAEAMLCCHSRITMLGISRWSRDGGSYRTIQRFYHKAIPWLQVQWILIQHHLLKKGDIILLAGDETTVTKSGKQTHGLGRFFSSIHGRAVPGLGFFSLSLISVNQQKAYPLMMEQLDPKQKKETTPKSSKKKGKGNRGRPKGGQNKASSQIELSLYLLWIQSLIQQALDLTKEPLNLVYFLYDGAFGNNPSLQMVRQCGLHLISKLHCNSALYFPYQGKYSGRGPHRKYGDKVDYSHLPAKVLKESSKEGNIQTNIYQAHLWHKKFSKPLNVTIIQKINLTQNKEAHVVLFSDDLELSYQKMILYYRLRFQIEFTFRDAKQHWGLEDFVNVKKQAVQNAAHLSMFMVNFAQIIGQNQTTSHPFSVNDIKARFHAQFYVKSILKMTPQIVDPIFIQRLYDDTAYTGCIHQTPIAA